MIRRLLADSVCISAFSCGECKLPQSDNPKKKGDSGLRVFFPFLFFLSIRAFTKKIKRDEFYSLQSDGEFSHLGSLSTKRAISKLSKTLFVPAANRTEEKRREEKRREEKRREEKRREEKRKEEGEYFFEMKKCELCQKALFTDSFLLFSRKTSGRDPPNVLSQQNKKAHSLFRYSKLWILGCPRDVF